MAAPGRRRDVVRRRQADEERQALRRLQTAPGAGKVARAHLLEDEHLGGIGVAARAEAKGPDQGEEEVTRGRSTGEGQSYQTKQK